jgi:DNA-binding IclR family transcriptional regulator
MEHATEHRHASPGDASSGAGSRGADSRDDGPGSDQHRALGQALDLLGALARRTEPLPAAALAREVGLARSSTYRLLSTLADRGYVTHLRETGRFGLGPTAYELGSAYRRQAPLQRIAAPLLARLVDQTTHNAHLAILLGRDVLYVVEERATGRPRLVTDVGVRLPAEITASGLALLAALPAAQVRALYPRAEPLVQREQAGPRTPTQLRQVLRETRQRGYAVESGSVTEGLDSVAVAVLDHVGHPAAAVAVTYPSRGVDAGTRGDLVERVRRCAAAITARLAG